MQSKKAEFDAIWMYKIEGKSFKQITDPVEIGVFDSHACYFIIFYYFDRAAISLWRGAEQDSLNFKEAISMFRFTNFRPVSNLQQQGRNRSTSIMESVSTFKQKFDLENYEKPDPKSGSLQKAPSFGLKSMSTVAGTTGKNLLDDDVPKEKRKSQLQEEGKKTELKFTIKPKYSKDEKNIDMSKMSREEFINLEPMVKGERNVDINLRSMVTQDNEPTYFLQSFQGSVIISNQSYLERDPIQLEEMEEEQFVMLFQLFGVPHLNQKAREVRPFRSSLTSTGLFVMLAKNRILFWQGFEFSNCYQEENTAFDSYENVISEELLTKLMYHYNSMIN